MDPEKIQTVSSWPLPANIKALRGFLGLIVAGNSSEVIAQLQNLLRQC